MVFSAVLCRRLWNRATFLADHLARGDHAVIGVADLAAARSLPDRADGWDGRLLWGSALWCRLVLRSCAAQRPMWRRWSAPQVSCGDSCDAFTRKVLARCTECAVGVYTGPSA